MVVVVVVAGGLGDASLGSLMGVLVCRLSFFASLLEFNTEVRSSKDFSSKVGAGACFDLPTVLEGL